MIEIIPAIDLSGGKCVRLSQGDFSKTTIYENDPVAMARQFEAAGLKRLHIVDLDGARTGCMQHLAVLERIAANTSMLIDFGGGIQQTADVRMVLGAGAAMVSIGSLSYAQPFRVLHWMDQFGADKILLGADVRDHCIATRGWQQQTSLQVYNYIQAYREQGLRRFFCTDVHKDGMLAGPATSLYHNILERFPEVQLIASGGVSAMADIEALNAIGCAGVIVGKALYEHRISLEAIKKHNAHAID